MTVLEALNKLPPDKWRLQSLADTFLRGDVKKKTASITFHTTPELVLQTNAAAVLGKKPEHMCLILWVDTTAWEQAKKS